MRKISDPLFLDWDQYPIKQIETQTCPAEGKKNITSASSFHISNLNFKIATDRKREEFYGVSHACSSTAAIVAAALKDQVWSAFYAVKSSLWKERQKKRERKTVPWAVSTAARPPAPAARAADVRVGTGL